MIKNIHDIIRNRRSVRAYKDNEIPKDVLQKVLDALRLAPSACNYQPWKFIIVTDEAIKSKLVTACKGQKFIAESPIVIVGCGYPQQAYPNMAGRGNSAEIDVTIAMDHLTLSAAAEGLGTCWIGAFSEKEVKEILNIPDTVKVVALMPLGYPAAENAFHPVEEQRRKLFSEVFSYNGFSSPMKGLGND